MNTKHACALVSLSFALIATVPSLVGSPASAQPVSHRHKIAGANSLPALAGSPLPAPATSELAASVSHLSTIPLIPGIGGDNQMATTDTTATSSSAQTFNKTMNVGESEIFEFDRISTTAVGDPNVADITPLSRTRLLVSAKGTGHTTVFVYDKRGKNVISVTVLPSENMNVLAAKVEEEIGIPTVTVRAINDTLFLEGSAPTVSAAALAEQIAKAYSSKVVNMIVTGDQVHQLSEAERYSDLLNINLATAGIQAKAFDERTIVLSGKYALPVGAMSFPDEGAIDNQSHATDTQPDPLKQLLASLPADLKVINLINFQREAARQVLVRAKIVDIDRSSSKSLGLDWGASNLSTTITNLPGGGTSSQTTATFVPQPILFTQSIPTGNSGGIFKNALSGGGLTRFLPFAAQVNALIQEGKARVLSQPSLLVLDGNQANMLVGGEFPIPVLQGPSGGAVTVLFKPFGVRLTVAPTVVSDDTIQLSVTPEVSDLDFSSGIQINGTVIPGLIMRRATSTLQMKDGQTLVIGGLYSNHDSKNINKIPFISNVPILGEFFKSTSTRKEERELLVMLEAEIVTPGTLGATPPPADSLENLNIHKPFVPRKEFDQDAPDLQNGPFHKDPETPKVPVVMPGTGK